MQIKKGDTVQIIAGRERGKKGTVEKVLSEEGRLIVTGVNMRKHHLKPNRTRPKGGIVELPGSLARSNAMLVCPSCGKMTRGQLILSEQGKHRSCSACSASLDSK